MKLLGSVCGVIVALFIVGTAKYMGTAYVLDVQSLAASPPKLPGQ